MNDVKYIGLDVHQATTGRSWLPRSSSASFCKKWNGKPLERLGEKATSIADDLLGDASGFEGEYA